MDMVIRRDISAIG
jgi:hypothetical protein